MSPTDNRPRAAWTRRLRDALARRRVPVVLQMSNVECGAACLAMILGHHGRAVPLSECRDRIGAGRDGASAKAIAAAAEGYGLTVKAFSLGGAPEALRHVELPAVAHFGFDHFVVVERWSKRAVTIVDPRAGRRVLPAGEWSEGFTGVVVTFTPGARFERRAGKKATSRAFLRRILAEPGARAAMGQILLATLVLQAFGLVLPLLTKVIVDDVIPHRITSAMAIVAAGMAAIVASQLVAGYLRGALLVYLQAKLDARLMASFFEHLLCLPFRFFQERSTGDLLMRLGANTTIRETLTGQTISLVLDGALVAGYLAILLGRDAAFGLAVLAIGLLEIAVMRASLPKARGLLQRDLAAQAEAQSYLVEALSGIATVKACGAEARVFDRWSNLFTAQLNVSTARARVSVTIETIMSGLRTAAPLLLLWVGASRVVAGQLSVGTMLALNALAASFLMPLSSLVTSAQRLQVVTAHIDRLADVLDAEPEQRIEDVTPAPELRGRIEIDDVAFRYAEGAPAALSSVSLTIEPGQKVAIVGRTGSGKSTLARVLLGLYQPTAGEVRYDGLPLPTLDHRSVRRQLGVVLQEAALFSGSVRDNIALNAPDLDLEGVVKAARLAQVHEEIARLPLGYDTRVAEGGSSFSGGQRQRLSLARALASSPPILVLDEATSHLDAATERAVDQSLATLRCTRVVIAHRLSTVRDADVIVVLDGGRIVERGTHDALLAAGGHYAGLVRGQVSAQSAKSAAFLRALQERLEAARAVAAE